MSYEIRYLSRTTVRNTAECSACGAIKGEPCIRANGATRVSNHMERVELAEQRLGVVRPDFRPHDK